MFIRAIAYTGSTGFEPATSDVTGRRSNQLNYDPVNIKIIHEFVKFVARVGTKNRAVRVPPDDFADFERMLR